MAECSIQDCPGKPVARGLCSAHYYGAKRAGTLDELAPKHHGPCEHCGLAIPASRRYGAHFCSPECKEQDRVRANALEVIERRKGRRCVLCSRRIPLERSTKAVTCSLECNIRWQNEKKASVRRTVWDAARPDCAYCSKAIPGNRRVGSIYCSRECKRNALSARWRAKGSGYMRQYLYGITPEQFAARLAEQDGRCAICRTDVPGGKGNWHVDHDHATNLVRGLLCHSCNLMLGHAADDPTRLRSAIEYLEARASP